jgi:hypothetical protein
VCNSVQFEHKFARQHFAQETDVHLRFNFVFKMPSPCCVTIQRSSDVLGSHRPNLCSLSSQTDIFAFLGCQAALVGSCSRTFRDNISVTSSKLKQHSSWTSWRWDRIVATQLSPYAIEHPRSLISHILSCSVNWNRKICGIAGSNLGKVVDI